MKIKVFMYEKGMFAKYSREKDNLTKGLLYYDFDTSSIEYQINKFIEDKKVIDIKVETCNLGNNPPTATIIYTIMYEEKEQE